MFFAKKKKINLDELRPIFDAQKQTLVGEGFKELMGEGIFEKELENAWQKLEKEAQNINFVKWGSIPLLIAINFKEVGEGIGKINGHTELHLQTNAPENLFSILLDVEDGQKMVAKSPKDALKKFEKEKRSALNIHESIALLTHYPELLKDHYLISAGTFYTTKDNESLPLLWLLDDHGNPELHYAWFHIAHGSYGTGSYVVKI